MFRRVTFRYRFLVTLFSILLYSGTTLAGQIIYVDKDASDMDTGSSWRRAKKCLQGALAQAKAGDEIRVAQGIYKPDESFETGRNAKIISSGNRSSSFELKTGITIKGGYAGYGEPDPDFRDIELYETILSGDLSGNDAMVDDPCDLLYEPTRSENSYHVIRVDRTNQTGVLDGFIITGGNANGSISDRYGGGMFIDNTNILFDELDEIINPTIKNCTFYRNSSSYWGGGVFNGSNSKPEYINCIFKGNYTLFFGGGSFNFVDSNPEFINCSFIENKAKNGAGAFGSSDNIKFTNCSFNSNVASGDYTTGHGAGLYMSGYDIFLTDCTFYNNKAMASGGGIFNGCQNMILTNCKFICNTAEKGGGLFNTSSGSILTRCTFSANTAIEEGGAIRSYSSDMDITNCVFFNNQGKFGNALNCYSSLGLVKVNNCIFWDDENQIQDYYTSNATITYSDIKGGYAGVGNIDADPLFINPGFWYDNDTPDDSNDDLWIEGDYHLKSQAGRFDEGTQSWVLDDSTSPCIDAGDPLTPIGYEAQPNGSIINMGIYGGTNQSSISLNDANNSPMSYEPDPPDNAIGINLDDYLIWNHDANVITYEVYFGTDPFPPFVQKNYINKFDPGVLLPDTQYYWRIDIIDSLIQRYIGNTWTFLTGPEPNNAYNPFPENGSEGVLPDSILSWLPGFNAPLHTIYLDTDFEKVNNANINDLNGIKYFAQQSSTYFDPGMLEFNQTYYWRVDEQDRFNNTRGNIWTFKTGSISSKAYNPSPEFGAVNVTVGQDFLQETEILFWSPGLNAHIHNVYLGTDFNDVNNASISIPLGVLASIGQEPNFYQPDELEYNTLYYWRIDEIDSNGIATKGDIWEFTTETHSPKARCFTGQTQVWINGKTLEISKATVNQSTSLGNKIEEVQVHKGTFTLFQVHFESGNFITVADNHYFLEESGKWLSLHDLKTGMKLKTINDSIEIISIKENPLPFNGKVYNLKIKDSDQYAVGKDAIIVSDY